MGSALADRGHEIAHVTYSRRSAARLRRRGFEAHCLPEVMSKLGGFNAEVEAERIVRRYEIPTLRGVYVTDPPCAGQTEAWCLDRTVRHFLALERLFDELRPEIVVPEVGNETMRTAAHLIGLERDIPVLFLLYTIFPRPLRLYRDTLQAPIVPAEELRELADAERQEVDHFIADFTRRAEPIRSHRRPRASVKALREFARHVAVSAGERNNEYLRPGGFLPRFARERSRALLARRLYAAPDPSRPFVYFPLHVTEDYKIKRVVPHCADQASLIEQVAAALPHGYDVVIKEHPQSIGRNELGTLRRLTRIENVRLVEPHVSSHDLIRDATAVAVIGSTVGLEALLYSKPVLTLGEPFYSGYGVTLDVDDFAEIRDRVPELLAFQPDGDRIARFIHAAMRSCYAGAPVSVDASDENAAALAASLDTAARAGAPRTAGTTD